MYGSLRQNGYKTRDELYYGLYYFITVQVKQITMYKDPAIRLNTSGRYRIKVYNKNSQH